MYRVVAMTSSTSRNEVGDHGTSIQKEDFALFPTIGSTLDSLKEAAYFL